MSSPPSAPSGARRRRAATLVLLCLPAALALACGGDDSTRPDPIPGTYTLRTVNGVVLPWVTTWEGQDSRGTTIPITDSVHISSFELMPQNHEFAQLDSGSWSARGYASLTYAYRFSGTYAMLTGDTVRFTRTSGSFNREPLVVFGVFPDTIYGVMTSGRLRMVEEFFASEHPPDASGSVGPFTLQTFTKSYGK
ncbi:MAG TPA: hypothetical protein VKA84_14680 [Gemmatimonadaceae bacterium]|nr:hypothetical protein [Gemmatimonadaceae bacterium]